MLEIVGHCDSRIFGLSTRARLERQLARRPSQLLVVADASAVLGDATIDWLTRQPGQLILSPGGRPLAIAVDASQRHQAVSAIAGEAALFPAASAALIGSQFMRNTRRKDLLLALSIAESGLRSVERALFDHVYKGVTDIVTKWAWPEPAFWVTRAASSAGVSPNAVTSVGIALTLVTAILFAQGQLALGLVTAWLMTFLDTVDGKLARVTVTSSAVGNLLDHVNDYVHPPIWWACLASALTSREFDLADPVWLSCVIILSLYAAGRLLEEGFKRLAGFNFYMWRPFDSWFRLIVSRRNIILLIMTAGLLVGEPVQAFIGCALWSIASTVVQLVRFVQAVAAVRANRVQCWLM